MKQEIENERAWAFFGLFATGDKKKMMSNFDVAKKKRLCAEPVAAPRFDIIDQDARNKTSKNCSEMVSLFWAVCYVTQLCRVVYCKFLIDKLYGSLVAHVNIFRTEPTIVMANEASNVS